MNPNDFCYWLQGFAEVNGKTPTEEQWKMIKEHLQLVFKKVTGGNSLNAIGYGGGSGGGAFPITGGGGGSCGPTPVNFPSGGGKVC